MIETKLEISEIGWSPHFKKTSKLHATLKERLQMNNSIRNRGIVTLVWPEHGSYFYLVFDRSRWWSGYSVRLMSGRSWVRIPAGAKPRHLKKLGTLCYRWHALPCRAQRERSSATNGRYPWFVRQGGTPCLALGMVVSVTLALYPAQTEH